jgi:phosphoglycolate phosphatase
MPADRIAVLFDIDGTLIITGGAGAASWRLAFDELYGIPADIGKFTDTGMTDPAVGRQTFEAVMHREPKRKEFTRLLERRLHYLHRAVEDSDGYRVLAGVEQLLPELIKEGYLLGLVTGNVEAAAHIKLHRAGAEPFLLLRRIRVRLQRPRRADPDRAPARRARLRRTRIARTCDRGGRYAARRRGCARSGH